jgi:FMN phosphatase YigB (HAD superfamily)
MYDLNFGEVKGGEYSSAEDLYNKLVDIAFNNEVEINARFKPKETKHYNTDKTDAEYLWPPKSEEEKEKSDQPKEINNREDILSLIDKVRRWDKHWSDNMKLHPPQRTPVEELGEFIESISKKYIIKKREE